MPGRPPKPAHMRQRRNKTSTRATLEAPARKPRARALPRRGKDQGTWHPRVLAWWSDVWKSPMASEYLTVHRHGLEAIAELRHQFHTVEKPSHLLALHAEIRQSQRDYGLTPLDLRRLQWEVKRATDATGAVDSKPKPKDTKPKRGKHKGDPRKLLRLVK